MLKKSAKISKAILAFLVVFLTGFMPVNANTFSSSEHGDEPDIICNEYDAMVYEKASTSIMTLNTTGTNNNDSGYFERLYLERAAIDEDTLLNEYGYTEEQVKILKAYDGGPIEEHPELRRASATLSAYIYAKNCSTSKLNVYADWSWNGTPIPCGPGITDGVAFGWSGTDFNGNPLNLSVSNSSVKIKYVGSSGVSYRTVTPTIVSHYHALKGGVLMDNGKGTAKSGTLSMTLNKTGSKSINEAAITFAYGHATLTGGVSFSFSLSGPSVGISLSSGTRMAYESARVNYKGQTIS